jgi:acyl-CoA thioesterase-2
MPEVPGPENFVSEVEHARLWADKISDKAREQILCDKPIEIRHVTPMDPFEPRKMPTSRQVWLRAISPMPDDRAAHRYMLAYASDFNLMATSLHPHGHTFWEPEMQVASLDHAMWFHRDFKMDDWLLYAMKSPNACKARGLTIGRIFSRDGTLVATVAQEGLIRYHGWKK